MKRNDDFSVGDRVLANTENWGTITGVVVEVTLGRYVQILSEEDNHVYGVSSAHCVRLDDANPARRRPAARN